MIDQRMRTAEREQDERRLLLEQARAGDLLAAAEFMRPDEVGRVCREWLAEADRYAYADPRYSRESYWRDATCGVFNFDRDHGPGELYLCLGGGGEFSVRWTGSRAGLPGPLHKSPSLPALCRWLRDNLPRLRAEAGL